MRRRRGTAGALAATTGFLTGPIVIILIIAAFLTNFASYPVVQHAFAGIRVCVCVLIIQAVLRLWKKAVVDRTTLILYLVIFFLAVFGKHLFFAVPTALLVIASGVFGVFFGKGGKDK